MRARLTTSFRPVALERVEALSAGVRSLENATADNVTLTGVMREIHTLKGEAMMLRLEWLARVAHCVEDVLVYSRRANTLGDPRTSALVRRGLNLMETILDGDLLSPTPATVAATEQFVAAVTAWLPKDWEAIGDAEPAESPAQAPTRQTSEAPLAPAPSAPARSAAPVEQEPQEVELPVEPGARAANEAAVELLRISSNAANELTRLTGGLQISAENLDRIMDDIQRLSEDWTYTAVNLQLKARGIGAGPADGAAQSAEHWSRLAALAREMASRVLALREESFQSGLILAELRDGVASMRLMEVSTVLRRYRAPIRQLAADLGKDVHVTLEGNEVRVDKQVLDHVGDPLLHLLRNAVDHGLESPAERVAAGKTPHGNLVLSARHIGGQVELTVSDDGRGIDPELIRQTLVRQRQLSPLDAAAMTTSSLLEVIFRPGFSTRSDVTTVSGRGVGLDVVKERVEGLGGSVWVQSEPGRGTTFCLRLPISIALSEALLLRLDEGLFALPVSSVERVLHVRAEELEDTGAGHGLRIGDADPIPVRDISALLGFTPRPVDQQDLMSMVVLHSGRDRVALRVKKILNKRQLVQRALPAFLEGLELASGTAILEGGDILVFLNPVRLMARVQEEGDAPRRAESAGPAASAKRTVLVVEDSELTREMLISMVGRLGFQVREAVNGKEGIQRATEAIPDLVLTDLDMPILDGYGLIEHLRGQARTRNLPIVVLSTRRSDAEKKKAAQAGADAYLVKAEFDEALLARTLKGLLERGQS